jgi:thioredoxin-dependent peroxiredoxin
MRSSSHEGVLDHPETSSSTRDGTTPGDNPMHALVNTPPNETAFRRFPYLLKLALLSLLILLMHPFAASAQTPAVGSQAPDLTLHTPSGRAVRMSHLLGNGPLVLIVLRGYPGYQCPFCQRQVHDFITHAGDIAAMHARVLLIYPGPPAHLDQRAKEFLATESQLPANVARVVDPNYVATNLYGLRWNAPHETAYPSTFILNKRGKVIFEKISHSHGDRLSAGDALVHLRSAH